MEFNKCSRCGSFYISEGNVCPKCSQKDKLEFGAFKAYINENGFENPLHKVSEQTGISLKNLNRFVEYPEFKQFKQLQQKERNGISGKYFRQT